MTNLGTCSQRPDRRSHHLFIGQISCIDNRVENYHTYYYITMLYYNMPCNTTQYNTTMYTVLQYVLYAMSYNIHSTITQYITCQASKR